MSSSRKRKRVRSSRKKVRPSVIYKMQLSLLFRKTEEYHQNELKVLFEEHYRQVKSDEVNKQQMDFKFNGINIE